MPSCVWGGVYGGGGGQERCTLGGALKSVQVTEGNVRGRGGAQGTAADTEESTTGRWRRLRLLGTPRRVQGKGRPGAHIRWDLESQGLVGVGKGGGCRGGRKAGGSGGRLGPSAHRCPSVTLTGLLGKGSRHTHPRPEVAVSAGEGQGSGRRSVWPEAGCEEREGTRLGAQEVSIPFVKT